MSWDYPTNNSLKERIDKSGLHPITCLTTLTKIEKQQLLDREIVLCMQLCEDPKQLNSIISDTNRKNKVISEAQQLCVKA